MCSEIINEKMASSIRLSGIYLFVGYRYGISCAS
ncbi:unnamed protein product [Schistosoma mattheei]|uniref:Uncharacterized protein n=1 Tax=Schistosoma mattheei TaxID=31246 RepID=A0A183Q287_9TREM|nr:unnamed protein product [Schistosoma mattheei]